MKAKGAKLFLGYTLKIHYIIKRRHGMPIWGYLLEDLRNLTVRLLGKNVKNIKE